MSTTGPEPRPELRVPRPDEAAPAGEMAMAREWLVHLRESAIFKLEDLDDTQLRWRPTPAANSLGQLVVHLGYAERLWLRVFFAGEPMDMSWRSEMFDLPDGWSVDDVISFYRAETGDRGRARRRDHVRRAVGQPGAADHSALDRHASDRGDGPSRRAHGHHSRAARRPDGTVTTVTTAVRLQFDFKGRGPLASAGWRW